MPEKKKSFLEKNLPSLAGKGKSDKRGKKLKSIGDTTKEARVLREKEETRQQGQTYVAVEDASEIKGYKPSLPVLPYVNLLPTESRIALKKRTIWLGTILIVLMVLAATVLLKTFTIAQTQRVKNDLSQAQAAVVAQQAVNAKYEPLQRYFTAIQTRLSLSSQVNQLFPPYPQILNGVQTSLSNSGMLVSSLNIKSSNDTTATSNSGAATPNPSASGGGGAQGKCGPVNNPYETNTKSSLGCLTIAVTGTPDQAISLNTQLSQLPYLSEVYVKPGSATGSGTTTGTLPGAPLNVGGVELFTVTASIVSEDEVATEQAETLVEGDLAP